MSQTTFIPDRTRYPQGPVTVEPTRPRQTETPAAPFRDFLAGGVSVLLSGAQVATHVLGAPTLAAAVQSATLGATSAVRGVPAVPAGGLGAAALPLAAAAPGAAASTAGAGPGTLAAGASDGSDLATMQAMQRESQAFNMQLLNLQEEVQQENRRFSTLSNVLRAKHDTAKAAVSNIRS
jgi:hypothetical protein